MEIEKKYFARHGLTLTCINFAVLNLTILKLMY